MRNIPNPTKLKAVSDFDLKQSQIQSTAKLCIDLILIVHIFLRLCVGLFDPTLTPTSKLLIRLSISFSAMIPLVIALEYFLFKKKGPGIITYSKTVDLVILLFLLADWIVVLLSSLYKIQQMNPPSFKITSVFGFTAFSWRTLLMTLLFPKWQWKIIGPIVATSLVTGYAISYDPSSAGFLVVRALVQLFNIIVIFYCEDKIKWKLMWTNIQHERWMEVNNFILNNIPENIMILDLAEGKTRFMSNYCKDFMNKCQLSLDDGQALFKKIQDLQQQYEPASMISLQMERITTCNRLCTDIEEETWKTLDDLIRNFPNLLQEKNLQERQFLAYDGKLKSGQEDKSIEVKISFVQNFENDYIILILRDMTQRDLLVQLEETNEYKDQLLASVSHELRAPLNGNINLVEGAINSQKIPEAIKENFLIPALQSSKILLHIVNDIIDMSQIKQKKLRLVFQSGDLKETLNKTSQLVELQAKMKGVEFKVELDHNLPKKFCSDHIRVSQIVLNLLNNAIKFTTKGTVKLIATRQLESSYVKIIVEDSGIGMSQEKIQKVSSSNTRIHSEGMGLGLSITSSLVELLAPQGHQNLTISSVPNQGSIFSLILEDKEKKSLEIQESKDQDDSCEVAQEFAAPFEISTIKTLINPCVCPKVLIVDDNPFNY